MRCGPAPLLLRRVARAFAAAQCSRPCAPPPTRPRAHGGPQDGGGGGVKKKRRKHKHRGSDDEGGGGGGGGKRKGRLRQAAGAAGGGGGGEGKGGGGSGGEGAGAGLEDEVAPETEADRAFIDDEGARPWRSGAPPPGCCVAGPLAPRQAAPRAPCPRHAHTATTRPRRRRQTCPSTCATATTGAATLPARCAWGGPGLVRGGPRQRAGVRSRRPQPPRALARGLCAELPPTPRRAGARRRARARSRKRRRRRRATRTRAAAAAWRRRRMRRTASSRSASAASARATRSCAPRWRAWSPRWGAAAAAACGSKPASTIAQAL